MEECGNAVLDAGEACDDGNQVGGDGCNTTCHVEECGNGTLDLGEACDDGNLVDGDGCTNCLPDGCSDDCTAGSCSATGTWEWTSFFGAPIRWSLREEGDGSLVGIVFLDASGNSVPATGLRIGESFALHVATGGPSADDFAGTISACGTISMVWEALPDRVIPVERVRTTYCGDGIVQAPLEACDDGDFVANDACTNLCAPGVGCGNGIVNAGEECDDGNPTSGDGCSACAIDTCGNAVVDPDEDCDDGNLVSGDGCSSTCEHDGCSAVCDVEGCPISGTWRSIAGVFGSDEYWTIAEQPDGSFVMHALRPGTFGPFVGTRVGPLVTFDGLGVTATTGSCGVVGSLDPLLALFLARRTHCGDGILQADFEECDDGNLDDHDGCSPRCEILDCGNGVLDPGEACDDGNFASGDGCDRFCAVETCWLCAGAPSTCGPVADGEFCNDGLFCTATSSCSAGVCVGSGLTCAAGLECARFCDEQRATCGDPAGTACLDDGVTETEDICDGYGRCSHPNPGDPDEDGIRDDGDGSGAAADHPCSGGQSTACDDNCRLIANADQADADGDGVGDACDHDCFGSSGASVAGTVYRDAVGAGNEVSGAYLQVCSASCCAVTTTDAGGHYLLERLNAGTYEITAWGSTSQVVRPTTLEPRTLRATDVLTDLDIVVQVPVRRPPGANITSLREEDGVPVLPVGRDLDLSITGCPGGAFTYEILQGDLVVRSGVLTETEGGVFSAVVAHWNARSGSGQVLIHEACPAAPATSAGFDFWMWIDPSGYVRTGAGAPVAGATVTLLRADDPTGPFTVVPDGSGILSPANRRNPDVTDADGHFGWDVLAGWYVVRTERGGCATETPALRIPPPVTDLDLRLACPQPLLCYQAADRRGAPKFVGPTTALADLFATSQAQLRKPSGVCAPATVAGDPPGAPQEHLLVYPQRPAARFAPVRDRIVKDRFGTLRVDVMKPLDVQPPSAVDLGGPAAAPTVTELDDFQCYGIKLAKGMPRFAAVSGVSVGDGFGSSTVQIKKPRRLCVPVNRDGREPGAATHRDHLMCYQVKLEQPLRFARVGPIFTANAIGERQLDVVKPKELCVPALSSR